MEYLTYIKTMASKHKKDLRYLVYIGAVIALLFAVNFTYLKIASIPLYVGVVIAVSLIIFFVKFFVARFYSVRISGEVWVTGLIFSFVVSLVLSSIGVPVLIPVISMKDYRRLSTIKGLKKGEVNIHEKWKIIIFSAMIILSFAMLFMYAWKWTHNIGFFAGGIALAMFVFVDFLPIPRFEGSMLVYHNQPVYIITLLLLVLIGALSLVYLSAALYVFVAFIIMNLLFYRLKLW